MSNPSSSKLLSSENEHEKVFYGQILLWVLEKLLNSQLIGVGFLQSQLCVRKCRFIRTTICISSKRYAAGLASASFQLLSFLFFPLRSLCLTYFINLNIKDGLSVTHLKHWAPPTTKWRKCQTQGVSRGWFPLNLFWEYLWHLQLDPTLKVRIQSYRKCWYPLLDKMLSAKWKGLFLL